MAADTDITDRIARVLAQGNLPDSSDFDLNQDIGDSWPSPAKLRPAAVLLPLIKRTNGLNVILTKRASHLKHHPGQISLPGGKVEESDADVTATALREAEEEIGLMRSNVEILGVLPYHQTITSFRVTPVIGRVCAPFEVRPEAGEVAEVFEVPFSYLADPANFRVEGRYWGGVKRYYYTIPYGPYYIWGATARILRGLAESLVR
jgi:8-oxo-dGTP pyrophosphatase MutT (NUDIX family)